MKLKLIGSSIDSIDEKLKGPSAEAGQNIIDALTALRLISPNLDHHLHRRLATLLPTIILALQSHYSIIRHTAALCFAALCDVMIDESMKAVIDGVVPLIGDARRVPARQGAVEAVHREFTIFF